MKAIPCKTIERIICLTLALAMLAAPGAGAAYRPEGAAAAAEFIVQASSADQAARLVAASGGETTSRLEVIRGVGARLSPDSAAWLRRQPGVMLFENASVQAASQVPASDYPDNVGADVVWEEDTAGGGVTVAVVDTGLGWHPGLYKKINGQAVGRIVGWKDFVEHRLLPRDPNGHGTHVAGIIANTQVGSDAEWDGVAPGVKLVGVRVLNEQGAGTYERVIQGIQWVINRRAALNIRVMNLSLVSPVQSPYWADPLNQAIMAAWAEGIVVVAAAGNGGPGSMSIGVPGNNPYVITAGAFTDNFTPSAWDDDYITPFSAAGPTLDGFVKPDVVAPGAHMVSSMLQQAYLAGQYPQNVVNNRYFQMAGTSQAAAVVSGVAALVLSEHPELTPNEVKFRIMATAFPWVDPVTTDALYSMWQQGAGRVNAPDAVFADLQGEANQGMDVLADWAGQVHYEGFSEYDSSTGTFHLRGDFTEWAGGYGTWSGGYGTWSGGYGTWSGGYGTWSGGYGTWSGGYGTWSGGYGTWSGGYGTWSGGYGTWSGGYGTWSGGYGTWSGSEPWAGTVFADPAFVTTYLAGVSPNAATTTTGINEWVEEP